MDSTRGWWNSAELLCASKFSAEGYVVLWPHGALVRYDFAVDLGQGIVRIQVKRAFKTPKRLRAKTAGKPELGRRDAGRAGYYLDLKRTRNASGKKGNYSITDFDYLAVVCREDLIFVIPVGFLKSPVDASRTVNEIEIKPIETAGPRADEQKAGMRWEPYRNNFTLDPLLSIL